MRVFRFTWAICRGDVGDAADVGRDWLCQRWDEIDSCGSGDYDIDIQGFVFPDTPP